MRRSALRALALTALLLVAVSIVQRVLFQRVLAEIESGKSEITAIVARLESLARWGGWADRVLYAALVASIGTAASRARGLARALGFAGVALLAIAIAASFYDPHLEGPATNSQKTIFLAIALAAPAGFVVGVAGLALHARKHLLATVPATLWLAFAGVAAASQYRDWHVPSPTLRWLSTITYVALFLAGAIVAEALARTAAVDDAPAVDGASGLPRISGAPFRVLGGALIARIVIALAAQGLLVSALMDKDYAAAHGWVSLGSLGSAIAGLVTAAGLVMYLKLPERAREPMPIILALVLMALGLGLDLWASASLGELLEQVAQAQKASSFWGLPSLKKMEALQETASWGARVATGLGVIGALSLVSALGSTARAIGATELATKARGIQIALLALGALAIGLASMLTDKKGGGEALLPLAVGLLLALLWLLASWMQLLLGLAHAVEAPEKPETPTVATPSPPA
jgi:hypothetical protein